MNSPKEDTQRRMLGSNSKQTFKNPKLATMAIANRSPLSKNDNKQPLSNNTLTSKKQLVQYKQKNVVAMTDQNSPRNSVTTAEIENGIKREAKKQQENGTNRLLEGRNSDYAKRNGLQQVRPYEIKNVLPERPPIKIQFSSSQQTVSKSISLPNGDKYQGQFLANNYNGQGNYIFKNLNLRYQGEFQQGKQHGFGVLSNLNSKEIIYQGSWQYGMKNGEGRYTYDKDEFYNGEWANDQKHGAGIYNFYGGCYNGSWVRNKRQGKGSLKLQNGTEFKGTFENNQFIKGFIKYPNGDEYSGQMRNNRRTCEDGSYMQASTKTRYKGGWYNDKKQGKGTIIYESGDQLSGTFTDGILNEQYVVMYKWRDNTVFNGWFINNVPNKGSVSRSNGQKWQI